MFFAKYLLKRVGATLITVSGKQEHSKFLGSLPYLAVSACAGQLDLGERYQANIKRVYPAQRLQRSYQKPRMSLDIMICEQNTHECPASDSALASSPNSSRIVCARCSASFA